jgi:ribose/xylose/arabinose/galactoside ABC-type transport system permease subunit
VIATQKTRIWGIWASSGVALLVGAAAGFFNGIIITKLKLPSLVVQNDLAPVRISRGSQDVKCWHTARA